MKNKPKSRRGSLTQHLTAYTISELAPLIEQGEVRSLEVTQAYLERITTYDPLLVSYATVTEQLALRMAQQADDLQANGTYTGPLHGIPLGLKDLFDVQGVPTTACSPALLDNIAQEDATVVQKLKAGTAVLLGKQTMGEWAMKADNSNPLSGTCRNPWNTDCDPGGSSGGSAVAVAAGLAAASLGTDSGGSTRIPAAFCGIVGFKPTLGRISNRGVIPLSWSLDTAGLFTRSVEDAALLLQQLAGFDPQDPYTSNMPVPDYRSTLKNGVRGWNIAFARAPFLNEDEQLQPDIAEAFEQALHVFERLGARLHEVEPPADSRVRSLNGLLLTCDAAAYHYERLQKQPEAYSDSVRESLTYGAAIASIEYARARHEQTRIRRSMQRFFADYDLLLTPTTPVVSPPLAETQAEKEQRAGLNCFTAAWNLTGLPALTLPCGFSKTGLPIGLQIVGNAWNEPRILCAATAYEQACEWSAQQPALHLPTTQEEEQ